METLFADACAARRCPADCGVPASCPLSCPPSAVPGPSAPSHPDLQDWSTDCCSHLAARTHGRHKIFLVLGKSVLPEYLASSIQNQGCVLFSAGPHIRSHRALGVGQGRVTTALPKCVFCLHPGGPLALSVTGAQRKLSLERSLRKASHPRGNVGSPASVLRQPGRELPCHGA